MKIKKINANLSNIYMMDNFNGVIKQLKKEKEWLRGDIVIATREERVKNTILAHKLFPNFFPKAIALNNETYIREFINSPTLDNDPKNLEKVIEKMAVFHKEGITKIKNKKGIKIHRFGDLWEKGYSLFGDILKINEYATVLTYTLGDAKASNILSQSPFLSFDTEGFGIGDISEDITALIEGYQAGRKTDMVKKTLKLAGIKYSALDKNIVKKTLLGLAAIRSLEVITSSRQNNLYKESIEFLKNL